MWTFQFWQISFLKWLHFAHSHCSLQLHGHQITKLKKQMVSQAETAHHCLSGSGAVWGARWEDSGNVCVWLRPVFQTWRHWRGEDSHEHHWPWTTDRGVAGSGERWSRGGAAQKPTFLKEIFLQKSSYFDKTAWPWNSELSDAEMKAFRITILLFSLQTELCQQLTTLPQRHALISAQMKTYCI